MALPTDISRFLPVNRDVANGVTVATLDAAQNEIADTSLAGTTSGTVVASVASVVGQTSKVMVIEFTGYEAAAASNLTLPESFTEAVVIVSPAWTTATLATPTVTGSTLALPAIAAAISTTLLIFGF